MMIQNIPVQFLQSKDENPDLYIYDFKMTQEVVNTRVNLTLNMLCFLQSGEKKVRLGEASVEVNTNQSLLVRAGNCLMTELPQGNEIYFCKLFFFSNQKLVDFLDKYNFGRFPRSKEEGEGANFFVIQNDDFIRSFAISITSIFNLNANDRPQMLAIKFEEIMLYLSQKYGNSFIQYLQGLVAHDSSSLWQSSSSFRSIIEANVKTNLSLSEIAFLFNMSLSTFKRHFEKEYKMTPGKWFQQKRLNEAKKILDAGYKTATEIFSDYGYNTLSSFSAAFKKEFGYSPKKITESV